MPIRGRPHSSQLGSFTLIGHNEKLYPISGKSKLMVDVRGFNLADLAHTQTQSNPVILQTAAIQDGST